MQHRITQAITARADDGPPPAPAGVSVAEPSARPGRAAFLGGRGAKLFDVSGRSWIDCDLGGGALILGHAATAVQSALEATLASGWSVAAGSDVERLCALIAAAVPHHDDVRLFAAAWQAQGFAVAQACLATGRRAVGRFAHRRDSVGGPIHARIANGWTVTERTMRYGDASDLADLAAGHLALAAVIVDAADFVRDPDGFEAWLNELSAACAVQGTRLILDDTATGFKLAYGGLQEHLGFEADAALFGRIVGGGIPLAAVTSTRAGADRPARDAALHGGESDGGFDPFALAAGA
ncbi:MAG: hypothetical protein SFV21_19250, partial [Rhodospirillaceae bacterium]|nr:hypothetical protein [Rhodospirillaceae bacterium]